MRKLTLSLLAGAAAITAGGTAYAQPAAAPAGGELTRAAAEQRATQMFQRLDVNGDGQLDQADREARQKARFDRIDADGDGAISFAEFTAPRERAQRGDRAERGQRMTRQDGEGRRIGMRGMRAGHPGFFGKAGGAGGDRVITQAEFVAAALERFDRLDANKDGVVTREEQKAARDAMREQRQAKRATQAS